MVNKRIVSPTGKEIVLSPVRPNAGIRAEYRRRLLALVDEMNASLLYWLSAEYKSSGAAMALDATPAADMQKALDRMGKQWLKRFDEGAKKLGDWFAKKNRNYADLGLKKTLKDAGLSVEFKPTVGMMDAYKAVSAQQVGLIRSIAQQNLAQVGNLVMESVSVGREMSVLTDALKKQFGLTQRRAELIARDQNNKATAVFNRTRRLEIGITQARWRHSTAGHRPRPEHVAAGKDDGGKGRIYDVAKGCYLEGVWTWPGHEINCLPGDSVIEFAAGCKKLWRRWYDGKLSFVITNSGKMIKATPNHPILTNRGWIPIKDINIGDYIINVPNKIIDGFETNVNSNNPSISEIFNAIAFYVGFRNYNGTFAQFHGDGTKQEINAIDMDGLLSYEIDSFSCKRFCEFFFPYAQMVGIASGFSHDRVLKSSLNTMTNAPDSIVSGFCALLAFIRGHSGHADNVSNGLISGINARLKQAFSYSSSGTKVDFGQFKLANSGIVFGCDFIIRELFFIVIRAFMFDDCNAPSANVLGQNIARHSDYPGNFDKIVTGLHEGNRIINCGAFDFSGHVYNLENELNWYTTNTYIVHNCRCYDQPILPGIND